MNLELFVFQGFEGFSSTDERRERKSDFEVSEDEKKTRIGIFKKKASKASSKLRRSLSRKRRPSKGRSIDRTPSLTFEDIHDVEELRYVSEFRQSLISDYLLPPNLDDYHMMLRSFFFPYYNHVNPCISCCTNVYVDDEIMHMCFMTCLLSVDSCMLGDSILEKQS